jgi:hypothetical protein
VEWSYVKTCPIIDVNTARIPEWEENAHSPSWPNGLVIIIIIIIVIIIIKWDGENAGR